MRRASVTDLALTKPYGIQFGGLDISSDYFVTEIRGKQALDVMMVAHGMTHFKAAVNWTQQNIDKILMVGSELCHETKDVAIEKLVEFTKGFILKKKFIKVTVSEPLIVGKIMTITKRSIDLRMGLEKFFTQHKYGIFQTPTLDLYIIYNKIFYVFDPRARSMNCERSTHGEASLMAFLTVDDVYHLILNLSRINIKDPFKICNVSVSGVMDSKNSPEKFIAMHGNPKKTFRSDDFKVYDSGVSCLRGSVHFNSSVFGDRACKHPLTTAIMAMVYAKIDPPNTWSSDVFDRVFHFGMKLYNFCIDDEPTRNLTLADIPSRFYIGENYRASIKIAPFIKRVHVAPTHVLCENSISKALIEIVETTTFRCLLLQLDNFSFAVWHMMSSDGFYFFDGYQKDVDGVIDRFEGSSYMFIADTIDKLCALVVNRMTKIPLSDKSMLNIHGMKIFELKKLTKKEQNCKPKLKMEKPECIKPMTPEVAQTFDEVPSTIDSISPVLHARQILKLREKLPEKPLHRKITDLNSPSLVCARMRAYEEIISTVEQKLSAMDNKDFTKETINLVRTIHSDILKEVLTDDTAVDLVDECRQVTKIKEKKFPKPCEDECDKLAKRPEKFMEKTNLGGLEQESEEMIKSKSHFDLTASSNASLEDQTSNTQQPSASTGIVQSSKKSNKVEFEL